MALKIFFFSFLVLICFNGYSQWNSNPAINTPVCTAMHDQRDIRIVTDKNGGAIISWEDLRADSTTTDIYVQRIDANGFVLWTIDGIGASVISGNDQATVWMTDDGVGGAIMVWKDFRNGNSDIYGQRINAIGNLLWLTNGLPVAQKASAQVNPVILNDGNNGAIVAWEDSSAGNWDIYAQNISWNGTLLWNANGVAICSAANEQLNPKMISDGNHGAVITWQDKRNGTDHNIYAQRINSAGTVQWTADGVIVCNYVGTQNNPKVDAEGAGHFVIAWADKRNGNDYNIYAQSIDSVGAVQWAANGVAICTSGGNQSAIDIAADTTGIFIAWKDGRNGIVTSIYAQRVSWSGVVQWTANGMGVMVNAANQVNPNIVSDDNGGIFIVWQDDRNGNSNNDVYSQRLSAGGTLLWNINGVATGIASNDQISPKQISDGSGNMITAWHDKRNGSQFDIYAQKIFSDGSLPTSVDELHTAEVTTRVYPNPFAQSAEITWHIAASAVSDKRTVQMNVYDVNGKLVFQKKKIENSKMNFNRENLNNGIYFYEIIPEENVKIISKGKFIITD